MSPDNSLKPVSEFAQAAAAEFELGSSPALLNGAKEWVMETSFASAPSTESLRASLSAGSYESGIALVNNTKDSEGMQDSGMRLSARERTIVLLMGHGLTNKVIARQLSIAPETVKSHAKRIFWKLTVQTRAQAVYRASALGLI